MKRQGLLHRLRIRIPGCAAAPFFHDPDGMWDIGQGTPLSDDLKYLFTACKGQPIQDVLYNTDIYELPVEN